MITLKNNFHNTEYETRKTRKELDSIEQRVHQGTATEAEKAFMRRVRAALCGMDDCKCATSSFGER